MAARFGVADLLCRPRLEHVWFAEDPSASAIRWGCAKCGATGTISREAGFLGERMADRVWGIWEKHAHPAPKPLTAAEREQIRISGMRWRGSWRGSLGRANRNRRGIEMRRALRKLGVQRQGA